MLCRFPTSLEPVTFDLIPQPSPFHCGPSEHWHYSPSKAWKRSLCSTVRRGGAHRNSGGARSQRADLGAGKKKQVTKDRATYTLSHLKFPVLCLFFLDPMERFRKRRNPRSSHHRSRYPLHRPSFSPLGLWDISLLSL